MPSTFNTTAGDLTVSLTPGPGQGGGAAGGPGCLVIDSILGGASGVATAGTVYRLLLTDSNGTAFDYHFAPGANTTTATPINFSFPNGSGPRLYGDTPELSLSGVTGAAVTLGNMFVSYHYE